MPRAADGNYALPPGSVVNAGDVVLPSQHNPALNDVAQALTTSLSRTGSGGMLANLDMGGFTLVNLPGGTALLTTAALSVSGGSALVGTIQAGTGAVSRTVERKLRERVSALDFGAKGDGTTDDRAAIQAALDYVATQGGGTVVLPMTLSGRYRITAGLKMPSYTMLQGAGPVRYPFNAGNANSSALLADFAEFRQWVIEPKTTKTAGGGFAYNEMVTAATPFDFTYDCAVRDLLVTSTGTMPYGGIRMHGCPGSVVDNVAIDRVGCGLLVNYSFGGSYSVQTLTPYYGVVAWDDVNAGNFEVYAAQKDPFPATVPAAYLMPFMASLNGALVPTHKLATNAHYNRPTGFAHGSLTSTSNTNAIDLTVERFGTGIFLLYANSVDFRKCYLEGSAGQMVTAIVAAQTNFSSHATHDYQSGTGALFDLGLAVTGRVCLSGTVFPGSFGTVYQPAGGEPMTRLRLDGVTVDQVGPAVPQYNVTHDDPGLWKAVTLTNATLIPGDVDPGYRREGVRTFLQGAVNVTTAGTLFTLDVGHRPYLTTRGPGYAVTSDGVVTAFAPGVISFAGFSFEATS